LRTNFLPSTNQKKHARPFALPQKLPLSQFPQRFLVDAVLNQTPTPPPSTTLIKHTIPVRKKTHHSTRRQNDTRASYIRLPTMPASALAPHCMRRRTIAVLLLLSCSASAIPAEAKTRAECILKGWGRTGDGKGREAKGTGAASHSVSAHPGVGRHALQIEVPKPRSPLATSRG
jgi:hypothetical protein